MRVYSCISLVIASFSLSAPSWAEPKITILDTDKKPVATVMVSRFIDDKPKQDLSDNGYSPHGVKNQLALEHNRFTDAQGQTLFKQDLSAGAKVSYRIRKPGYKDQMVSGADADAELNLVMEKMTDPTELAMDKPSNVWVDAMDFEGDIELKKHFQLNCAFCHQQGNF